MFFQISSVLAEYAFLFLLIYSLTLLSFTCRCNIVEAHSSNNLSSFGKSMLGGFCPRYVPDLVLQGLPSDVGLQERLLEDLNHAVQVGACFLYNHYTNALFTFHFLDVVQGVLINYFKYSKPSNIACSNIVDFYQSWATYFVPISLSRYLILANRGF